jgi:hypothetical protein
VRCTITAVSRPASLLSLSFVVVLLVASTPVFAQSEATHLSQPGSGSVGGSIFWDLSGEYERLGSKDGTVGPLWNVYGTVFVTPRIAFGAELSTLGTREISNFNPSVGDYRYLSRSTALYGVARVRVVRRALVSVDALGGIGGQFAHREYHFSAVTGSSQPAPSNTSDGVTYLSYVVGAEMPIAVARHISVSPYARVYFLRGLPHQPTEQPAWYTGIGTGMTAAFRW